MVFKLFKIILSLDNYHNYHFNFITFDHIYLILILTCIRMIVCQRLRQIFDLTEYPNAFSTHSTVSEQYSGKIFIQSLKIFWSFSLVIFTTFYVIFQIINNFLYIWRWLNLAETYANFCNMNFCNGKILIWIFVKYKIIVLFSLIYVTF